MIDESAFSWCESAKTIAFPESLRYMYQNAFSKANKIITKDYLPDGLFNAAFVADTPSENNMYDIVEITDGKYKLFLQDTLAEMLLTIMHMIFILPGFLILHRRTVTKQNLKLYFVNSI